MISSLLEQQGCEIRTAGTGLEALEVLESYHPDIVFTDLIMPQVSSEEKLIGVALGDITGWGSHRETICLGVDKQLAGAGMKSHKIYDDSPIFIEDRVVTALFLPVIQSDNINSDSIMVKTTGAGSGEERVATAATGALAGSAYLFGHQPFIIIMPAIKLMMPITALLPCSRMSADKQSNTPIVTLFIVRYYHFESVSRQS
jgi:hypothetical protein